MRFALALFACLLPLGVAAQQPWDWMSLPPSAWCTSNEEPLQLLQSAAAPTAMDTRASFEGGADSPYETGYHASSAGISVQPEGPTGSFLRLVDGGPDQLNWIGFQRTRVGAHCTTVIELDARVATDTGSAEGFGVVLAHTGRQGVSGATPAFSEEPNLAGSVGVGFDAFANPGSTDPNGNHVSIHFDGEHRADFAVTPALNLGNTGGFMHVRIEVTADRSGGVVGVELTPPAGNARRIVDAHPLPGLMPYEARLVIAARTGAQPSSQDFDNIHVSSVGCPSEVGAWESVQPFPIVAIHASLLPNGKVLAWDRDDVFPASPYLFDPTTGVVSPAANEAADRFCAGHVLLEDGRLFVAGGHDGADRYGLATAALYDGATGAWTSVAAPMNAGRWYPTATVLEDGKALVVSGTIDRNTTNTLPQVFDPRLGTWRDLTTANVAQPLYPMMFLAPDGRVFAPGPQAATSFLSTSGTGAWTFLANTLSRAARDYGSAVMLGTRVMLLGGGAPLRTTELIDLSAPAPTWRYSGEMHFARRQLNATILPDGSVFASGGTSASGFNSVAGAVYAGEIFEALSERWRQTAAAAQERIYHGTSLLLPDGRVFTAGSGRPSGGEGDHLNYEIFSPPYLFRGARPSVSALGATAFTPGSSVNITTPDAARIAKVTLVRLGSVTHAFDQNQRFLSLAFVPVAGGVQATMPANNRLAPPGHYLLFLVDTDGVPSIGRIVKLGYLPIAGCGVGPELSLVVPLVQLARRRARARRDKLAR